MKLSALNYNNRRSNSFRQTGGPLDASSDGSGKSPASIFWLFLHGVCCLVSLVLGFRFSRIVFFLLFSTAATNTYTATSFLQRSGDAEQSSSRTSVEFPANQTPAVGIGASSRVVVGRHGIRIRPWPHPNPEEVMKAHQIIERVQKEQRLQYGIRNPRSLIVVTPTYVRTFQTLHLTGVMHSLMLVPTDLTWIVVEAGGTTNETASLIAKSGLKTIHIGFDQRMPTSWEDRHRIEVWMRLQALRIVREEKLDGIVMFADDSNMHSMELFDAIQSVKWFGAVSVGILIHSGNSEEVSSLSLAQKKEDEQNSPMPIQGPACNASDILVGWHTFNSLPFVEKSASDIGDMGTVLPRKLEWAGFVLNSRLLWKEAEDPPDWFKDLDMVAEDIDSPLSLLKDPSVVEPLGSCGRKVMLWWLRVEARGDSKFPPRWRIDPPLEITVASKRTPWPDAPPELPVSEKIDGIQEHVEKRHTKNRSPRSKRSSRSKRKHESVKSDPQASALQEK